MRQEREELNGKLSNAEQKSDEVLAEIKSMETQIELKMKQIDKQSRILENLRKNSEASDLSPTELKVIDIYLNFYVHIFRCIFNALVPKSRKEKI